MFGGRLIPSTLIGAATAAVMFVIGGAATAIGVLPAGASAAFALIGFSTPIAIGLHADAKEAMKNEQTEK